MKTLKKVILFAALLVAVPSLVYLAWLPDVGPLKTQNPGLTSYMKIRMRQARAKGKEYKINQVWVPLDAISDNLKRALIVIEDEGFYYHKGIEPELMKKALVENFQKRHFVRGASTITQQLARNLYLSPSKNVLRKIKEIEIAFLLEKHLSKRRIFEIYINVIEWGDGIYGAEAASRAYFGKSADDLTMEESALMVSVLPKPRKRKPTDGSKYVQIRSEALLKRLGYSVTDQMEVEVSSSEIQAADFESYISSGKR
jgi:monofunctional biosynthetic peptidoglycan transglycosylase